MLPHELRQQADMRFDARLPRSTRCAVFGLSFVIFVGASNSRLNEENLLLQRERWARSNSLSVAAVNEIKYRDVFTPRRTAIYRMVERSVAPRSGIALRKHPAIKSITVLHDPSFLVKLLQWHPDSLEVSAGVHKRWEDATFFERFTNHFSTYVNGSVMAHDMRPITKQTIEYGGRELPQGQMFLHELRGTEKSGIPFCTTGSLCTLCTTFLSLDWQCR